VEGNAAEKETLRAMGYGAAGRRAGDEDIPTSWVAEANDREDKARNFALPDRIRKELADLLITRRQRWQRPWKASEK